MAVEIEHCWGDGASSSLLSSSGPEGKRLSKIQCISISVLRCQTISPVSA